MMIKLTSRQECAIIDLFLTEHPAAVHMRHLNEISFNYTARISDLRRKGFVITKHRVGKAEFKYTLDKVPHRVEDDNATTSA